MVDNKKTVTGNIFASSEQGVPSVPKKTSTINFKQTWGQEAGEQPGFMLEVLSNVNLKKIGTKS